MNIGHSSRLPYDKCFYPDHLEEGTQQEKLASMFRDGHHHNNSGPRPRAPRKQNRKYRYSEQEIQWIRDADHHEIAQRYNLTPGRASSLRSLMRLGFKWLPWKK